MVFLGLGYNTMLRQDELSRAALLHWSGRSRLQYVMHNL